MYIEPTTPKPTMTTPPATTKTTPTPTTTPTTTEIKPKPGNYVDTLLLRYLKICIPTLNQNIHNIYKYYSKRAMGQMGGFHQVHQDLWRRYPEEDKTLQ